MMKIALFLLILSAVQKLTIALQKPRQCSPRTSFSSVYCVCNSTYCDDAPKVLRPDGNSSYTIVSSGKGGMRFSVSTGNFGSSVAAGLVTTIQVDPATTYQEILGFGSSMSDSAGLNINSLSESAQEELLKSYFSDDGLEYTMVRVPMGASDFSTRPYSYAEKKNDVLLKHFALAKEDFAFKIPYLQRARELNERPIKLIASPWSASPWMKTNDDWVGAGSLKREYWQSWANYFVKFFQEYANQGLDFWALTPQNEPLIGFLPSPINTMGWTPWDQHDWIVNFLVPILGDAGFGNIDIITGDGLRHLLPEWPKAIMGDPEGRKVVAGTGVHWYTDFLNPVQKLDETHDLFPEKYIIYTESCAGPPRSGVDLGSWDKAEAYAQSIIETISHWVAGWVDWNMALDLRGGPNWVKNFVDSPIIVNTTADEFYKQPSFYVMGHFSKYVPPGSVRISTSNKGLFGIPTVAFRRPDNATVIVLLNTYSTERAISVQDTARGTISVKLPGKSIHTLIYW